jgi:DNA polymerase-3 subunit epsilon
MLDRGDCRRPDTLVAFDVETATEKYTSACALAVAVINAGGVIEEQKYWLIRPPANSYSAYNIRIHGITPRATWNLPMFDELWENMRPYFERRDIVAHHAVIDVNVLAACLEAANLPPPECCVYCSCIAARRALTHLSRHKLPAVCRELGIPLSHHHDAACDAAACAFIAHRLKGRGLTRMSWEEAKSYSFYRREFNKKSGWQF